MSSSSRKRKLEDPAPAKYYAVRAGHTPGVYRTWAECQKNTTGFKGASYKAFLTEKDAMDFCAGRVVMGPGASSKSQEPKFYGVAVGKVPGVYEQWVDAQAQIVDVKGPKYKKFATRAEAEAFVKGGKVAAVKIPTSETESAEPSAKKAKTSSSASIATASKGKAVKVYTDGSSLGNGKKGAISGVGVYFGDKDKRNISEPLAGDLQTNNRAELVAIQRALEIVGPEHDIHIVSDSNYSIKCLTEYYVKWEKNGYIASSGEKVLNPDLIQRVRKIIRERDEKGVSTKIEWVKAHAADPGNIAADHLAVAGAQAAKSARGWN